MARIIFRRMAPAIISSLIICGALTGCVYPAPPYAAIYPAYGGPRPVVVAGGWGGGWGWRHWR